MAFRAFDLIFENGSSHNVIHAAAGDRFGGSPVFKLNRVLVHRGAVHRHDPGFLPGPGIRCRPSPCGPSLARHRATASGAVSIVSNSVVVPSHAAGVHVGFQADHISVAPGDTFMVEVTVQTADAPFNAFDASVPTSAATTEIMVS